MARSLREVGAENFKDLLFSGAFQITEGYVNDVLVIQNGEAIHGLVDFEVGEKITAIEFQKDNAVLMTFDDGKAVLSMLYELDTEDAGMRIFTARGTQDFLKKENWVLTNISLEDEQFELHFTETIEGSEILTRLVLKKI
ncbi:hypothetical protein [Jiulongibacter sp. NS-SX5]|uniref:hypothetical protein n=1 Tax=Jiulongibacter sp. NS-SX5 TaxID=3463854 RepID=UPI00405A2C5D